MARSSLRSWALAIAAAVVTPGQLWADERYDLGRKVFLEQAQPSCSLCHTLADAGATGAIGPDLDELAPTEEQVLRAVSSGVGVMPAFAASLSDEQIAAVAHYVATASSR